VIYRATVEGKFCGVERHSHERILEIKDARPCFVLARGRLAALSTQDREIPTVLVHSRKYLAL